MSIKVHTIPHAGFKDWFPAKGLFSFRVKGVGNLVIGLSSINGNTQPLYQLYFQCWNNTKTSMFNLKLIHELELHSPKIVSANEFRGFWMDWNDGMVRLGHDDDKLPFFVYRIREPFQVNYIGIRSGSVADWIIDKPRNIWESSTDGSVPEGSLVGGEDSGSFIYVGRAHYAGELVPGKVLIPHKGIYIPFNGREVHLTNYEVFVTHGPGVWIRTNGNNIPAKAIVAGKTASDETLFVGRVLHNGTLTPGKVQPSHRVCYISYGGKELSFENYEILIDGKP